METGVSVRTVLLIVAVHQHHLHSEDKTFVNVRGHAYFGHTILVYQKDQVVMYIHSAYFRNLH